MIRIEISAAAYAALAAVIPDERLEDPQKSPQGGFYLWLTPTLADRLAAARAPGEAYSDAIIRMAAQ